MPHCAADPAIEFCDDFESADEQVPPYGFASFPGAQSIVAGPTGNALQIYTLASAPETYGITPKLSIDGTHSSIVIRFDANLKYYTTKVAIVSFDNGISMWLQPNTGQTKLSVDDALVDYSEMGAVSYQFYSTWMTYEIDIAFATTTATVALKMSPQGTPLETVIAPYAIPNDIPATTLRVYLGEPGSLEYLVALDNIIVDY